MNGARRKDTTQHSVRNSQDVAIGNSTDVGTAGDKLYRVGLYFRTLGS